MPRDHIDVPTLPAEPDSLLAARLIDFIASAKRDALMVARSEDRALRLFNAAKALDPSLEVLLLPAWDTLAFDRSPPSRLVMGQRMEAVHQAARTGRAPLLLIGSVDAVSQRLLPASAWSSVEIGTGDPLDPAALGIALKRIGYLMDDEVDEPGQVAIRASVIDIFPPASPTPLRIDHAGGRVTDIRAFDTATQRSVGGSMAALALGPAAEAIMEGPLSENEPESDETVPFAPEFQLSQSKQGLVSVFDLLPEAAVVLDEETDSLIDQRINDVRDAFRTLDRLPPSTGRDLSPWTVHFDHDAWSEMLRGRPTIPLRAAPGAEEGSLTRFARTAEFVKFVRARAAGGTRIGLTGPERHRRELLRALGAADVPLLGGWRDLVSAAPGTVARLEATLDAGFTTADAIVIAPADVLGAKARPQTQQAVAAFETALAPGDCVVHLDHGIGVLKGIETVDAGGVASDCLQLGYAGDTGLLVPAEEIERIWRYGADAEGVSLDRLQGETWPRRRAEIVQDMRETAKRLAALAQEREAATAPALAPDRARYARLVARFPFAPTPDQEGAFAAVEADLAAGKPMERLVCGDVGFGKTEVAIRAAGMAALSGFQVALAVPTTVLARQHIETFQRRFAGLGVKIAGLSRLTPPAEARAVRAGLADGSIDIVIGTQAIASRTVRFVRLALLIVDEEQRFGVRQKTALRTLGPGIHLLTLTATPIPRTLQAALAGLQDLSVLATPPSRRQPIRTVRTEFSAALVAQALRRERRRGGQSFVVCPRVSDLEPMRSRLKDAARELRIIEANGEMKADALDDAMLHFARGDADVLLSTNIIEAGLDLPRANTMLIWRPDQFGLAQMHQLRGRVGRGRVRGVVYLISEPGAKLSAAAMKRVAALEDMNRLGSGFAISARDLDLRGAGDLLGDEQAGHIKLLGQDLYRYLLERALRTARGEPPGDEWTPEISLGIPAFVPDSYISDDAARVALYDRLGRMMRTQDRNALDDLRNELEDRFGPMPEEVENLILLTSVRLQCRVVGIAKIDSGPNAIALTPRPNVSLPPHKEATFKNGRLIWPVSAPGAESRVDAVRSLLDTLANDSA